MPRCVAAVALMLALASCLRSPALGRACAPRIHGSKPRPSRLLPPRANIFEEINEEAKGSWISRFLPDGERKEPGARDLISEQPVLFTKVGALCPPHSRLCRQPALGRPVECPK